jgi:pimeloyl-ACP methyl ester carboxylesterase
VSRKYSRRALNPYRAYCTRPHRLHLNHREVSFRSPTGKKLTGWFIPRHGSKAAVLILNGNTGNMSYHLLYARFLFEAGFNVMLFDYQGFGRSAGKAALLSLGGDALAAYLALRNQPGVDPRSIGLFGISLGSILALHLASEAPDVGAVVAEAPYEPGEELLRVLRKRYRPSTASLAARLIVWFGFPAGFRPHDSVTDMRSIPVFFVHGENDRLLRPQASLRLYARSKSPRKLWLLERTGHSPELLVTHDLEYQDQITHFFRRHLKPEPESRSDIRVTWRFRPQSNHRHLLDVAAHARRQIPSRPVEIIAIGSTGRQFARFRRYLAPGRPLTLPVSFRPADLAVTPYFRVIRRGRTWDRAVSNYTRWYRRMPWIERNVRRRLYRTPADLSEALRILDAINANAVDRRIRPRLGALYAAAGTRLASLGRRAEAVRCLTKSLKLAPNPPRDYYTLGDARFSHGAPSWIRYARRRLRALTAEPKKPRPF